MKSIFIFISLALLSTNVVAQGSWFNKLKIRQSFNDDDGKQNPALFSITHSKDKKDSYLVDIGLGYALASKDPTGSRIGNVIAEYHRTNLTDAEVNNFQIGYKHQLQFKLPKIALPQLNVIPDFNTFRLNSTLKYRRDEIEGSNGIASSILFSYFQQGSGFRTWWNSAKISRSKRFHYILSPQFGIEMQENFNAKNTIDKGFVGRGVAELAAGFGGAKPDPSDPLFPIGIWLLNVDAMVKYDVVGQSSTNSKFHPLIKTSLDFYILYKPVKLIIGARYVYGDNPIEGFKEFKFKPQQFWVIAFKIQK